MNNIFSLKPFLTFAFFSISCCTVFGRQSPSNNYQPDTVTFRSGDLSLKGFLWKPSGPGPFPAILYNHGSEAKPERFLSKIAPAFLEHGYALFVPFRRGQGLSQGQGRYIANELDSATQAGGTAARFTLMIRLHETSQLQDQLAALAFLKSQPGIDSGRIAVAGISFGGIQTMLMAERPAGIKAALNFAGAAMTWEKSPEIAAWMKQGLVNVQVPVYFIQAENDFSIKPSLELSAGMKDLGKPYKMKIYPPRGTTPMEGHAFVDAVEIWGPDVFPQLAQWMNAK